jgi:PAS domain S-box-containing protein
MFSLTQIVFLVFILSNYYSPYGIYISQIEHLQTLNLQWGEKLVTAINLKKDINFIYFIVTQVLLYTYFIIALIHGFNHDKRENSVFLLKSFILPVLLFLFSNLFFVFSNNGILISDFLLDCGYFVFFASLGIRNITGIFKDNEIKAALKQSEIKFRSLFDSSNDSILIINQNYKIIDCNKPSLELFGSLRGVIVGSQVIRFVQESLDDGKNWKEIIIEKMNTAFHGQPQHFECLFKTESNKPFYAEVKLNSLIIEGIQYLQAIIIDVTNRHDSEQKLKDIENKFNIIANFSRDVIWFRTLDLKLEYISPSYFHLLGYTPEEAYGLSLEKVFTPESYKKLLSFVNDAWKRVADSNADTNPERMLEVQQIKKDGTIIWTETLSSIIYDADNKMTGIIGVTRDITDRKRSDEQIRAKNIVIESSITAITICDMTGAINYSNLAFVKMLGFSNAEDILGKNIFGYTGNMSKANIVFANLIKNGFYDGELEIVKSDGTHFVVDLRANLYENEFNEPEAIMLSCIDITDRKIWEESMKEKNIELERINAEKDKFFSILAHDLKSPFNGFLGFTKMMAEETDDFTIEEMKGIAVNMRHSATNIYKLLENLLDWSLVQRKAIKFDPVKANIRLLLEENIEIIKHWCTQKQVTISLSDKDDLYIFADSNMINTVIRNFLSNAVKYSYRGGEITVTCKASEDRKMLTVGVKDNGIGIPKENIVNLFRLDIKTSTAGTENEVSTGLGLVVCKEFIQKHFGKIWLESQPGKGTTSYFSLPISDAD